MDAFAPLLCVLCRGPPGGLPWLCVECASGLLLAQAPFCLRCGAACPLATPFCAACPDWPERLHGVRSAAPHEGTAKELVHALKFARNLAAARPLGHLVSAAARDLPLSADVVVVPVPLHPSRRRQRGFNQAAEIARGAARELGLALRGRWLWRIRPGGGLGTRTARGRARAVRGVFRAHRAVQGRSLLLVDDVCTTGATLGACVRALGRRGAGPIWAVTVTRAL